MKFVKSSATMLYIHYRVAFVSCDTGMMGQLIKMEVLEKLNKEYGNDTFRNDNLVLSATHTHSGPAGYMQYLMYTISSFGFVEESFQVPTFIILHFIIIHRINGLYFDLMQSQIFNLKFFLTKRQ